MSTIRRENEKVYLEGVRKVSWETGEMCEFASSLLGALLAMGETTTYPFILGTSGVAFRFTLNPGQWDFGNYSIHNVTADPYEAMRRAIQAQGYAYAIYERGTKAEDSARIRASIDAGKPALAYPVVGPCNCSVVTGYDEGGEVLMGWSTFQDIPEDHNIPPDSTGYFRKPGWHDNLTGYVILGDKTGRPPLEEIYLDALRFAVYLARTPRMGEKITGLAGIEKWAEEMTDERYFARGDLEKNGVRYISTTLNITQLRDHTAAEAFLCQAAEDVPGFAPELLRAAERYSEIKRRMAELLDIINDNFNEKAIQAVDDPTACRAFADKLLEIRDLEAEAVGHIEGLLARVGGNLTAETRRRGEKRKRI